VPGDAVRELRLSEPPDVSAATALFAAIPPDRIAVINALASDR
jgi:hypothetical protein